jgi:hypothetical protein
MLEQLDNQVKLAKNAITSASKTGPLEVVKLTDEMSERLHDGVIRVNDEIDMVTGWIALAEAQPRTVAPPAPDTTPTRD